MYYNLNWVRNNKAVLDKNIRKFRDTYIFLCQNFPIIIFNLRFEFDEHLGVFAVTLFTVDETTCSETVGDRLWCYSCPCRMLPTVDTAPHSFDYLLVAFSERVMLGQKGSGMRSTAFVQCRWYAGDQNYGKTYLPAFYGFPDFTYIIAGSLRSVKTGFHCI